MNLAPRDGGARSGEVLLKRVELDARGFSLYEKFRPRIPEGKKGWGAQGEGDRFPPFGAPHWLRA